MGAQAGVTNSKLHVGTGIFENIQRMLFATSASHTHMYIVSVNTYADGQDRGSVHVAYFMYADVPSVSLSTLVGLSVIFAHHTLDGGAS